MCGGCDTDFGVSVAPVTRAKNLKRSNMELSEYTTEELRAELSRRYKEKKAADALKPRCRNCKYLMRETIGGWFVATRCGARTYKLRGRDTHYCVRPSGHCDKFEKK